MQGDVLEVGGLRSPEGHRIVEAKELALRREPSALRIEVGEQGRASEREAWVGEWPIPRIRLQEALQIEAERPSAGGRRGAAATTFAGASGAGGATAAAAVLQTSAGAPMKFKLLSFFVGPTAAGKGRLHQQSIVISEDAGLGQ